MKIIQIAALPFGGQSSQYQTFGMIYALSDDGRIFFRSEEQLEDWVEDVGVFPAPKIKEAVNTASNTPSTQAEAA